MNIYNNPELYDLIFSYRNIEKECTFLIKLFKKFSKIKVKSILDIASGPSPHGIYFVNKGYRVGCLDKSAKMIAYLKNKIPDKNKVSFYKKDMKQFKLNKKFDACICMLASFHHLLTNEDIISHLRSVAQTLKSGGLYIIELENPKDYVTKGKSTIDNWKAKGVSVKWRKIRI